MRQEADLPDDAWERMAEALGEGSAPAAPDHGEEEEALLSPHEKLRATLRLASTASLKAALLTAAVHVVRSGGERLPGVTAPGVRKASRLGALAMVCGVHGRSDDDSQMMGLALEHALS